MKLEEFAKLTVKELGSSAAPPAELSENELDRQAIQERYDRNLWNATREGLHTAWLIALECDSADEFKETITSLENRTCRT